MDFELNETERMLEDSLIRFEEEAAGQDAAAQWAHCAAMGWLGAQVAEEAGGFGLGLNGAMLIGEALAAAQSPLNWQVQAALPAAALGLLAETGETAPLEAFLTGERRFAVLASHPGAGTGALRVSGEAGADVYLLPLGAGDIWRLALIEADALTAAGPSGVTATLDEAALAFRPLPAGAGEILARAALVAAAADHLGAMRRLCDMTLEYTKTRQQFGRPLSAFQALQHRLVDMAVAHEETRALIMAAAMAGTEGRADATRLARAAWAKAKTAGHKIGEEAIQLHGGIGMTEECDVGRHVRRMLRNRPYVAAGAA